MGRGGTRIPGEGKKLGRPRITPELPGRADKGIATRALASIDEIAYHREFLHAGEDLKTLNAGQRAEVWRELEYLTNKRDGKPAQGVFVGDTRESARDLDFGDLPDLIAASQPIKAGKPN